MTKSLGSSKYGKAPVGKTLNCQFERASTMVFPPKSTKSPRTPCDIQTGVLRLS